MKRLLDLLARAILPFVAAALTTLVSLPAFATDPSVEKQAQVLQKKAIEEDSLNVNYPEAIKKVAIAISKCAGDKCNAGLMGTLYRDIGAMLILSGSVDDGRAAFAKALGFDASLELDPAYKNPTLEQPWNEAKKKAGPGPEPKASASGSGGATGQASAEGVKGQPPAGDVTHPPAAAAGCPPDSPGCHPGKKAGGEECANNEECESGSCANDKCTEKKGEGEECDKDDACASGSCADGKCTAVKKAAEEPCESDDQCMSGACANGKCAESAQTSGSARTRRIWIGVGGSFDFISLPASDNVCILGNTAGYSCVDPTTGAAFPADPTANRNILQGDSKTYGDGIGGGFSPSNVRVVLSFDYALGMNVLLGARAGYVFLTAPSPAFAPIHLEARGTLLVGKDALAKSIAPMLVLAAGAGEFDASFPVVVQLKPPIGGTKNETAWITAGPVFAAAGAGVRFLLGPTIAATILIKGEGAFGGSSGFLFGIAPEVGVQLGL